MVTEQFGIGTHVITLFRISVNLVGQIFISTSVNILCIRSLSELVYYQCISKTLFILHKRFIIQHNIYICLSSAVPSVSSTTSEPKAVSKTTAENSKTKSK